MQQHKRCSKTALRHYFLENPHLARLLTKGRNAEEQKKEMQQKKEMIKNFALTLGSKDLVAAKCEAGMQNLPLQTLLLQVPMLTPISIPHLGPNTPCILYQCSLNDLRVLKPVAILLCISTAGMHFDGSSRLSQHSCVCCYFVCPLRHGASLIKSG